MQIKSTPNEGGGSTRASRPPNIKVVRFDDGVDVSPEVIETTTPASQPEAKATPPDLGGTSLPTYGDALKTTMPGCVSRLAIPHGYAVTLDGVFEAEAGDDDAPSVKPASLAPVGLHGRYVADDGTTYLAVTWRQPDGVWVTELALRSDVMSGAGLSRLAGKGFPSAGGNAKVLVEYLARLEKLNFEQLARGRISTAMGWQGQAKDFLWGTTLLTQNGRRPAHRDFHDDARGDAVLFRGDGPGDEQLIDGYHAHGEAATWYAGIEKLAHLPRFIFMVYAALVPPLLEILRNGNFVAELAKRTSTGKTSTLMAAASVWGCPDAHSRDSAIRTWDSTEVGLERLCGVLTGLPVILDDTSLAASAKGVGKAIYLVSEGQGRKRGSATGIAKQGFFRTVLLSSGESPATEGIEKGGARTRVLSLRDHPFGAASSETAASVKELVATITQHYGHAGPAFVEALLQDRARWPEIRKAYEARRAELATRVSGAEADRLVGHIAAVDIAATLAHRYLPLAWDLAMPGDQLLGELVVHGESAGGAKRAMQSVISWVCANERRFHGRVPEGVKGGIAFGRWDADAPGKPWEYIAFYPHILQDRLKAAGFVPTAILSDWGERGWLRADKGNHTYNMQVKPGEKRRMIVVLRHALDEAEA